MEFDTNLAHTGWDLERKSRAKLAVQLPVQKDTVMDENGIAEECSRLQIEPPVLDIDITCAAQIPTVSWK